MSSETKLMIGVPVAWFTDDHLSDKSATTYDKAMAERWLAKGWPVTPLYAEQPAPAAKDVDASIIGIVPMPPMEYDEP